MDNPKSILFAILRVWHLNGFYVGAVLSCWSGIQGIGISHGCSIQELLVSIPVLSPDPIYLEFSGEVWQGEGFISFVVCCVIVAGVMFFSWGDIVVIFPDGVLLIYSSSHGNLEHCESLSIFWRKYYLDSPEWSLEALVGVHLYTFILSLMNSCKNNKVNVFDLFFLVFFALYLDLCFPNII